MKFTRLLSGLLVLTLALCLLPMGAVEAKAATTVIHQANDTTETVLTNYDVRESNVDNQNGYSTLQTGTAMAQDGFFNKNKGLAVTWMVQAPEAGLYTFDPYYYIGNFGALKGGVYNMVWSINDTRYYLGTDITKESDSSYNAAVGGTLKVVHGMDVMELPLEKGVNIVRMLPVAGPNYVYQKVDRGDGNVAATYVNIFKVGIDSRLTVRKNVPVTVSFETEQRNNSEFFLNQFSSSTTDYGFMQSGQTYVKNNYATLPDYDTLNQSNLSQIPYVSYTLNAPEDGWYDMTLNLSMATYSKYGNDGYLIVRVNGVNYKRWIRATDTTHPYETNTNGSAKSWPFSDQNISVPLKRGVNTVTVTCGVGMKGGTESNSCEKIGGGYGLYTRIKKLTVYGGVTVATKVDPTTVADAPLATTTLEAETYGAGFNGYTVSGSKLVSGDTSALAGLPSLRALWDGEAFQKNSAPYVAFTVDVPTAGTYTLRADYTLTAASGKDALDYYMSASVNDTFYDKARFEPAAALSRTDGYSDLTLELEAGVNVIRLLPLLEGNPAAGVDIDKITFVGAGKVEGVLPRVTELKAVDAPYINKLTADGELLTGATGSVTEVGKLNMSNVEDTAWYAYTLDVPKTGYYDLHVRAGIGASGAGSMALLIDGQVWEEPVTLEKATAENTVDLSRYLEAGTHTFLLTGVLGQNTELGALTVSGGIALSAKQVDPMTMGIVPLVKEGGLVPGCVYQEQNCMITAVPCNTTVVQFKSNLLDNAQAVITDGEGNVLSDTDILSAGCLVRYPNQTYYKVTQVQTAEGPRSVGADVLLALCNPVGRLVKHDNALLMESSASNFTLSGNLSGDISLTVTVDKKRMDYDLHTLFVEVDGIASYYTLTEGRQIVTIAEGLPAGSHTVKVSKGTEAYRQDMYIHSVTYTGTLQKAQAATRRIEFLGDSITAGSGVFFEDCGFGATHSYFSYANMTADALGADYYSVANGGWRFSTSVTTSSSIYTIYPYVSMHMQDTLGTYDHSWKPDVIVINLGTNDAIASRNSANGYTQEGFYTDVTAMLALVREKNPDAHIIWAYGMMIKERKDWIKQPVEDFAKNDPKVHWVELDGNSLGRGNHPDFVGSTTASGMLVEAICQIMDWDTPTATHATGDCGGTQQCEFCRHNALTLAMHTYTDDCDAACNNADCNHKRTAPHYSTDCTATTCAICGQTKTAQAAHSFANACDPDCDYPDCEYTRTVGPHSFVGDSCSACGATREAPAFNGASVTITDNLNLNFKVDAQKLADNGYTDPYVKFVFEGKSYVVEEAVTDGGLLVFSFPEIAPHRMGSKVVATLYVKAGEETLSVTAEPYSVADYCYNMLGKCTDEKYGQLRTLLVDMLQYGAAAQLYMDPYVSELVTNRLTAAQRAEGTQTDRQPESILNSSYEVVDSPAATWKSATLLLKDAVKVRLKFAAQDIQGLTVVVKMGEQSFTIAQKDLIPADVVGTYYVIIDQLDASELSEELLITVYRDGEKVSNTLRYSVESYAYNKRNDPDAALCDLLKALIRYGDAARSYVNREGR